MPPLNTFTHSCLALAIGQFVATSTQAATIVVNDTGDTERVDALCTLREAIESINSARLRPGCVNSGADFGSSDTINFNNDVLTAGRIYRTQRALLFITEDLVIQGPSSGAITIDGLDKAGIFDVTDANVTMNNLAITGGSATDDGGGIIVEGTSRGFPGCPGSGRVTLIDSAVLGNTAYRGGGIGVGECADVILYGSTVSGNSAVRGGGIHATGSRYAPSNGIVLVDSTVSGNSARSYGGGINAGSNYRVALIRSTVSNNSANIAGGIYSRGDRLAVDNSTISSNSAFTAGGIFASGRSRVTIYNSTISANSANTFAGGIYASLSSDMTLTLTNSIFAGNLAPLYSEIGNVGGSYIISSHNLLGDNRQTTAQALFNFAPDNTDITSTYDGTRPTPLSSILLPLGNNGGPTQTHALVAGSPAINTGDNEECGTGKFFDVDQRGEPREDSFCDIGSYELKGDDSSFFIVPLPNGNAAIFNL